MWWIIIGLYLIGGVFTNWFVSMMIELSLAERAPIFVAWPLY